MNRPILLLSGPVGSGKTTHLVNWCLGKTDVQGILSPVVNGRRIFRDIDSGKEKNMEARADESFLAVGKYRFSKAAFDWANERIMNAGKKNIAWLVIDEIGPLEIREEGFYKTVEKLLKQRNNYRLLLVVRDTILDAVVSKFDLKEEVYSVIDPSSPIFD